MASNGSVYTDPCLLVADCPQTPVRTGADAPVLLSHLRCLLLQRGTWRLGELSFLLTLFLLFLILCQTQNSGGVVSGGEQLHHLSLCLFLVRVQLFVLCQQSGILLFQQLDRGQFLQAQAVKVTLRRLAGNDGAGMFGIKFFLFFRRQFAILCVNLAGLSVSADVLL